MSEPLEDDLRRAAELIADAGALVFCAGAGMGVDSGLPDFRGAEGFWRAYPPYRRLGLEFAELADPVHFADDPALAWGFYGHRLALYRRAVPHDGFAVLRRWAAARPARVFTSNVDGQFQRAGFADEDVLECHGSIHHLQCLAGCTDDVWPAGADVEVDPDTMRAVGALPRCPGCGGLARPNILMFGDVSWVPDRTERRAAGYSEWLREHGASPVVLEIGAGTAVPTVRRHAESVGAGRLIRINPGEPSVRRGVSIPLPAAEALSTLDELVPV
jgi:NAD-dependent SIR2 family protein deacetylase